MRTEHLFLATVMWARSAGVRSGKGRMSPSPAFTTAAWACSPSLPPRIRAARSALKAMFSFLRMGDAHGVSSLRSFAVVLVGSKLTHKKLLCWPKQDGPPGTQKSFRFRVTCTVCQRAKLYSRNLKSSSDALRVWDSGDREQSVMSEHSPR